MIVVMAFAFVFIFITALTVFADKGERRFSDALAFTTLIYMFWVLFTTNILSVFSGITKKVLLVFYLIPVAVVAASFPAVALSLKGESLSKVISGFFSNIFPSGKKKQDVDVLYRIMFAVILLVSIILLFGAIYTVPYNYDSMTYHLARVAYWLDHKNVGHYITNIDRQIYSPVLCEYFLLHMMALSDNKDTFVNFLQYFCFLSCTYFVYENCRKLKINKTVSMLGAFVFATMPLTISESITTQNDLFATLIFLLFIYYFLDVLNWDEIILDKGQVATILLLSATVAFGYMAKTSICASMLMFMPMLLIVRIKKKDKIKKLIPAALIAGFTILVLIAETLIRTLRSSGKIMTDTASGDISVSTKNVSYIIVNICKNFSLLITQHLYRPLNGVIYRFTIRLASLLKVEVNNEAIAFHGFDFLHHMNMGDDMYLHDKTPSALAAYLALFSGFFILGILIKRAVLAVIKKGKTDEGKKGEIKKYEFPLGFAISSWLSFGFIMALLKWQPWGTRLMYPALSVTIMMSMSVIMCLGNISFGGKKESGKGAVMYAAVIFIAALSLILSIPSFDYNLAPAVRNVRHEAGDRRSQYFAFNMRQESYEMLARGVRESGVSDVGILISGDGYDYPLWIVFKEDAPYAKLRHITEEPVLVAGDPVVYDSPDEAGDIMPGDVSYEFSEEAMEDPPEAILVIERDKVYLNGIYKYGDTMYKCVEKDEGNKDALLIALE